MLDGSSTGEINALAILNEGEHYVSGGEDKVVKIWDYDEGIQYYKGIGHSGAISKVRKTVINSKGHLAVLFKSAHLGILKI